MAIGSLSEHPEVRKLMRKTAEETIPALNLLMSPEEDSICHEFATLALAHLVREFSMKVRGANGRIYSFAGTPR